MFGESKKELKEELENAELRAVTHFRKLQKIEYAIKEADINKEIYAITIEKIKRVLANG